MASSYEANPGGLEFRVIRDSPFSGADSGYSRPMSDYDRRCLTFALWYMQVMRAGR